jgi:hypothetical protein
MTVQMEKAVAPRRVRICRPAFQDMHHLVMPRLTARAQLRRHALKLRFWRKGDPQVADLDCFRIPHEGMFAIELADDFGLANGFRVIFCEIPMPEPDGTICVLSIMRADEPLTDAALVILLGRERIARERLSGWIITRDGVA